jgi:rhamnosyl/mannosyltransferase
VRIIHLFKDAYPPTVGGIELHVHELARSLPGHEVTVLTSSRSWTRTEDVAGRARIVRAPELARLCSTPLTPSWARELRTLGADVVHAHVPNPMGELACLSLDRGTALVTSFHADVADASPAGVAYARLQQRFLRRADAIVAASPAMARSLALAAHRKRVRLVPYGVDAGEWPAGEEQVQAIRRRHPGPLVLFLGRLVHYKGLEVLVAAMHGVTATLLVVGDGPRRPTLEARVALAGLDRRVVMVGRVANDERAAYYRAADVFALPAVSSAEAFGIAMLEAMSLGTPAVSTEVGTATSWVNQHGSTGLVVPLRRILGDPVLRRELGAAAAERARLHFSKQVMLDGMAEIYGAVAPGRHRPPHREAAGTA